MPDWLHWILLYNSSQYYISPTRTAEISLIKISTRTCKNTFLFVRPSLNWFDWYLLWRFLFRKWVRYLCLNFKPKWVRESVERMFWSSWIQTNFRARRLKCWTSAALICILSTRFVQPILSSPSLVPLTTVHYQEVSGIRLGNSRARYKAPKVT